MMYDYLAPIVRRTRGRFPFYKLTEFFRHRANKAYGGKTRAMKYEGFAVEVEPAKYVGGKLFWAYGRELPIMKWAHQNSRVGVFVDVGACLGEWSYYMWKRKRPVVAFEPNTKYTEKLFLNGITAMPMGLGNKTHKVSLKVDEGNEGFTKANGAGDIDVVPLDLCRLTNVTLMKIDVEGMELEVLQGAHETIMKQKPVIVVEDNNNGAIEYLKDRGYVEKIRLGQNVGLTYA